MPTIFDNKTNKLIDDLATTMDSGRRGKLETWLSKRNREHITIYVDGDGREQVWSWVQREPGRPVRRFFHRYSKGQVGDDLFDEEEEA